VPDGPVERCGSCGCQYLIPVLDLGEQPLPQAVPGRASDKRYPLRLTECARCTLVQLDYIVPQAELFPPDYPYSTGNTKALRDHFAVQARVIAGMISPGDLVVDIGGNDGTMLAALRKAAPGARMLLIEPTDQARKAEGAGIMAVQDYFTAELAAKAREEEYGPAKVIVTSNTFGHVPDPGDFLDGVVNLLADDGTFIIDNQDWHNIVQDLQVDTIYHEHLRYYTPLSLSYLLAAHGLLVTSWNRLDMHGGSFRATAVHARPELRQRAWGLRTAVRALVAAAAADGPLYAVGAPTRATPLVNWTGIGKYLVCACEIAGSGKIGAFIPGTIVPVVDEQKLLDDQPPCALLLAWDLAPTLVPLLRGKGYKGKFIVPLPEPRVLDD
jgi:hypothetical protein